MTRAHYKEKSEHEKVSTNQRAQARTAHPEQHGAPRCAHALSRAEEGLGEPRFLPSKQRTDKTGGRTDKTGGHGTGIPVPVPSTSFLSTTHSSDDMGVEVSKERGGITLRPPERSYTMIPRVLEHLSANGTLLRVSNASFSFLFWRSPLFLRACSWFACVSRYSKLQLPPATSGRASRRLPSPVQLTFLTTPTSTIRMYVGPCRLRLPAH